MKKHLFFPRGKRRLHFLIKEIKKRKEELKRFFDKSYYRNIFDFDSFILQDKSLDQLYLDADITAKYLKKKQDKIRID